MNGYITAALAIGGGILVCFWGYRLLKVTLGIMGAVVGASGGWALGLSLSPGSAGMALVCSILGAVVGAVLCIWLFSSASSCWGRARERQWLPPCSMGSGVNPNHWWFLSRRLCLESLRSSCRNS